MTPEELKLLVKVPFGTLESVTGLQDGELLFYDTSTPKNKLKKISIDTFNNLSKTAKPLAPTDTAPTVEGLYKPTISGTYANAGGLIAQSGYDTLFFFNGTTWTKSETLMPSTPVDGVVAKNNIKAVSGDAVFNAYDPLIKVKTNSLIFTLHAGQIVINTGQVNTSINWLHLKYTAGAGINFRVDGLVGITALNQCYRIAFYNSNTQNSTNFISGISADSVTTLDFTTPANTVSFAIQIVSGTGVGTSPSTSPYKDSVKLYNLTVTPAPVTDDYIIAEKIKGNINTSQITTMKSVTDFTATQIFTDENIQSIVTTVGAISQSGSTTTTSTYKRTSITSASSMVTYDSTKQYSYTGTINTGDSFAGVSYRDATFAQIGFEYAGAGVRVDSPLSPPIGTVYIAGCSYLVDPVFKTINKYIKSVSTDSKTIFVNASYSGSIENGNETTPYKTISQAISNAGSNATIMIMNGDYRETLNLSVLSSGNYTFKTPKAHKVRILGSNKIEGFTKTVGFTNVYQVPYTGTIINASRFGRIIYEDGNRSRPIDPIERHPLQKALSYRLPFTAILERTSVALVDSNLGSFYLDSANGILYISTSNASNPSTNGFSYEIAQRDFNTAPSATTNKNINITMHNLQFMYGNNGLFFKGFESVRRENISVIGVIGAGCFRDDTSNVISYNDEAAYCNGDGINGHFSSFTNYMMLTDNRSMSPVNIYFDPWVHDNFDDGMSHHENHRVIVHGILTEHNDDGGVRASNDANYTIYNGYSRKNGLVTGAGEGFSVVNPVLNSNRNGCKMVIYNSLSEGNAVGFAAISDALNQIELINCISRNNTVSELFARNGAKVISRNSLATNSTAAKIKVIDTGGIIEVKNDTLIS